MHEWNLYQSYLDLGGKRDAMFEWRYLEYQGRNFRDEMSRQGYSRIRESILGFDGIPS